MKHENHPKTNEPISQSEFAIAMEADDGEINELFDNGLLKQGATFGEWIVAYITHLRIAAYGINENGEINEE